MPPRSRIACSLIALAGIGTALSLVATEPLRVEVENVSENGPIPEAHALCEATPKGKSTAGKNLRPTISWSGAPKETKSYAVIVSDPDVPADFTDAGKDGRVVKANAPRQMFYHWALVDIPAATQRIEGGKAELAPRFGVPALNDLGAYMPDARNYGGPCPPWNDQREHRYHFPVYALDVSSLNLPPKATAKQAVEAIEAGKHTISKGKVVGTYTLNAELRKQP